MVSPISRRTALKVGALGVWGLGLADYFRLQAQAKTKSAKATNVIMIWLNGGPATIDIWDLKPKAPETIRGEFKPIPTSASGIQISEHMPKIAKVMNLCTLIRSLHHRIPEHDVASRYLTTGNLPTPAVDYPSLGSIAAKILPPVTGLPSYIALQDGRNGVMRGSAGYLGPAYNPFEVTGNPRLGGVKINGISLPDGFSQESLTKRTQLRDRLDSKLASSDSSNLAASLDQFQQQALDVLRSNRTKNAFQLSSESMKIREMYGLSAFGHNALIARRLIEAGTRFVTLSLGEWDTHGGNFTILRQRLLPELDRVLFALINDLDQRGLLDSTIVYCVGEFGRTPQINRNAGRDHWAQSMAVLIAGGGIKKGYCYGSTDVNGMNPNTDPCSPDDVSATIFQSLGIEPETELHSSTGRPIRIFREGKVLEPVLA